MYRDEAADLMAAAARSTAQRAPPAIELTARRVPPVLRPDADRPLPYSEPVGINDNSDGKPGPAARAPRRRPGALRIAARIVIAPLYIGVAAAAIGVIALFVRGFLAA